MMNLALFTILVVVSAMGTVGNLFIIGAVCLYKQLRILGHAFVVNLAVADLIVTAYIMPSGLATSQYMQNPFSEALCDFNAYLIMCTLGVSTQSLMLIAIERYVHICKTRYYSRIFTPRLVGFYIIAIWVYSTLWTIQGYTGWTKYLYGVNIYVCIVDGQASLSYNLCLMVFGIILPMVVLAFSYYNIFKTVKQSHSTIFKSKTHTVSTENLTKSQKRMQGEYRFVMTLFIIVIIYCICWAPTAVVMGLSGRVPMPAIFVQITIWLSFSNSSMNSLVYGIMNKNFRKGYKQLLGQLICCNTLNCLRKGESESCCSTQEESVSNSNSKAPQIEASSNTNSPNKEDAKRAPQEVYMSDNSIQHPNQQQMIRYHRSPAATDAFPHEPAPSQPPSRCSIVSTGAINTISVGRSEWDDDAYGFQSAGTYSHPGQNQYAGYIQAPERHAYYKYPEQDAEAYVRNSQSRGNSVYITNYSQLQHVRLKETLL